MADNCHTQRNVFHQALAIANGQQLKSEVMADEWCTMLLLPARVLASFMYKCKQNGKRVHVGPCSDVFRQICLFGQTILL